MSCAQLNHGSRGHEDQRRRIYDSRGAWKQDIPSFRRLPDARRGNRRRYRHSPGGALRAYGAPDAEGVLAREFSEDPEPGAHSAAVGSALTTAADARWSFHDFPRRDSAAPQGGGAGGAAISAVGARRSGGAV